MKRASIERVYLPKFSGNRELEEKDQVTVEMSIATIKEKEKFAAMKYLKKGKMEYVKTEYKALRVKVHGINNYFDDKGIPIDTADKLIADMKAGSSDSIDLAEELWNRIMGYDKLEPGEDEEDDDEFDDSGSGEPLDEKED